MQKAEKKPETPRKKVNPMVRNLAILCAVVVAVTGLTVLTVQLANLRNADPEDDPRLVLSSRDAGDVALVQVQTEKFTLEAYPQGSGSDAVWALKGYEGQALSQYRFEELTQYVAGLKAKEIVEDNPSAERLAEFGLDVPQATVTGTFTDDKTVVYRIGDVTPDDQMYYLQVEGKKPVFAVDRSVVRFLLRSATGYFSIPNLYLATDTVVLVELKNRGKDLIRIEATPAETSLSGLDSWNIVEPFEHAVNFVTLYDFLQMCSILGPSEMVDEAPQDLSQYGMDDPLTVLTLEDKYGDGYTLTIGDKQGEDRYYCMVDGSEAVYSMSAYGVDSVQIDAKDLSESFVALIGIKFVDKLTIDGKDKAVMTIQHSQDDQGNDKAQYFLDGQRMQESASTTFYQSIAGMMASGETGVEIVGEADLTLTFERNSNLSTLTLRFVPYGIDKYAIVDQNNQSLVYVGRDAVDNMYEQLDLYRRGRLNKD
nr:DUF4340 domain-containing protein [bacterium]